MTWPLPEDPAVVQRMRDGQRRAQRALNLRPARHDHEKWGWHGRTLSQPVVDRDGPAWLRLACAPADQADNTFWDGARTAEHAIPPSIPRPGLRRIQDWTESPWKYRAELYDMAIDGAVSSSSTPTTPPDLSNTWWTHLRTTVEQLTTIATDRYTIHQRYIDYLLPRYLGIPINAPAPIWNTAHGDLHLANLCAPTLQILDWEGWGLAPAGYDVATLHAHSLAVPAIATRVRHEFAFTLNTPSGRYAELVVIAELLQSASCGEKGHLTEPLRRRAEQLLHHTIPSFGDHECLNT